MEDKYFRLIMNAYEKRKGTLYAPKEIRAGMIIDAEPVPTGWENFIFTLRDGMYGSYHMANVCANLVDDELKDIISKYITLDYPLEFLPVKAQSEEYGDKQYYIMHFKIIFDVLDLENSVYLDLDDGSKSLVKPCLSYEKVKGLNIFNSRPYINDIIVSNKLRKEIKKKKLDLGMVFSEIRCI
jgi:hypothetical protein